MKKQTFNFYATPLNFWALTAMMMLAMVVSGIAYKFQLVPQYGMDSTLRFVSNTGLVCGIPFLGAIALTIRKKRIEIDEDGNFKYYSSRILKYTNTLDNLYYIYAADIDKSDIAEMVFCFNDRKIRICMPSHLPKVYEPGKYAWMLRYFISECKLRKKPHHTVFGVSKYVVVYWSAAKKGSYKIYSESKGRRFL